MSRPAFQILASEVIYDAMLDDEALGALPSMLAAALGARSAHLVWNHASGETQILSHSGYHSDADFANYAANYAAHDPWVNSGLPQERQNRAWNAADLVPEQQYRRTRFYNEFIRGMGDDTFHCAGAVMTTRDGLGMIGLNRGLGAAQFDGGEVDILAAMMPALARMLGVRARLHAAQRHAADKAALLDAVPLCVIAITADGRLAHANGAGEAALAAGHSVKLHRGRIVAAAEGGPALRAAIARATDRSGAAASTVPLSAGMVATVTPHLAPSGQRLALLLASPASPPSATEGVLRSGFGLTAAEAEVAVLLARGLDLRDIAERRGSAYATVRTQIRSIAGKTGCSRQSQIVAVVARLIGA